jgi:hypothetical protein
MSAHALVDVATYQQLTQFHITYCTSLRHMVYWVEVNPDNANTIYGTHLLLRFLPSNASLNKKNIVQYHISPWFNTNMMNACN